MAETASPDRKRTRSPGYPAFSLPEAIRKAELLYRHDKRNAVPPAVAAEHWGYSPASSGLLLSIATLKKFGLLEEVAGGSSRLVKLTDLALHILLSAEGTDERETAMREAAMCPAIHSELWQQFGEELPSDANLKRILIMEKGFGDAAATDVIREYKETISFAKVSGERKMAPAPQRQEQPDGVPMTNTVPIPKPAPFPVQNAEKPAGLRRYAFPLEDSVDAELYLPLPMTEDNYTMFTEMLQVFLKMSKSALIVKKSKQTSEPNVEGD